MRRENEAFYISLIALHAHYPELHVLRIVDGARPAQKKCPVMVILPLTPDRKKV